MYPNRLMRTSESRQAVWLFIPDFLFIVCCFAVWQSRSSRESKVRIQNVRHCVQWQGRPKLWHSKLRFQMGFTHFKLYSIKLYWSYTMNLKWAMNIGRTDSEKWCICWLSTAVLVENTWWLIDFDRASKWKLIVFSGKCSYTLSLNRKSILCE